MRIRPMAAAMAAVLHSESVIVIIVRYVAPVAAVSKHGYSRRTELVAYI